MSDTLLGCKVVYDSTLPVGEVRFGTMEEGAQRLYEAHLAELLRFIRGEGSWGVFSGGGINTHPGWSGENAEDQALLHESCCELERRGLIRRKKDNGDHVLWEPV